MRLFWKEWREKRPIVGVAPVLTLLLLICAIIATHPPAFLGKTDHLDSFVLDLYMGMIGIITALVCSSVIVAPEVGSGTLQLLSSLPVSRRRIWWIKIASSLSVLALSLLGAGLLYLALIAIEVRCGMISGEFSDVARLSLGVLCGFGALFLPSAFAAGALTTMLVDRAITAVLLGILVSGLEVALAIAVIGYLGEIAAICGLCILPLLVLWMSYRAFEYGETLKTSRKFRVMMPPVVRIVMSVLLPIVTSALIICAGLLIGFLIVMW